LHSRNPHSLGARRRDILRRRWPLGRRRLRDDGGRSRRRRCEAGSRLLVRVGVRSGLWRHVHLTERKLHAAIAGPVQTAGRVLLHEPVRQDATLLVPELPELADLDTLLVLDLRRALPGPGAGAGGAHAFLDDGEEEAVVGPRHGAEPAGEVGGVAGVDLGVVDDGANGLVQRPRVAGDEAGQVVGDRLLRRRVEAEAKAVDLRA